MVPTSGQSHTEWWRAVETIAGLVACGFNMQNDEDAMRLELQTRGFGDDSIEGAMKWLDQAVCSGTVTEVLDMIQPSGSGPRVTHPVERILMSDKLWRLLESWRSRGFIGAGVAERMLEGMRSLDTRDWEDDEIRDFIAEVLRTTTLPGADARFGKCLRGATAELYS